MTGHLRMGWPVYFLTSIEKLSYVKTDYGRLAQLGEHLVYTEGVGGSSPSPPTNLINGLELNLEILRWAMWFNEPKIEYFQRT